jgi:hypothetical protein
MSNNQSKFNADLMNCHEGSEIGNRCILVASDSCVKHNLLTCQYYRNTIYLLYCALAGFY